MVFSHWLAGALSLAAALSTVDGVRMRRYNHTVEAFLSGTSAEEPSIGIQASYKMISSGTCKNGYVAITSGFKCQEAAQSLGLIGTTVYSSTNAANPSGCYYREESSTKKLWFNTNSANTPATSQRRLICEKSTSPTRRRRSTSVRRRRSTSVRRRRSTSIRRRRSSPTAGQSVVEKHGKLSVQGNKIVDKTGAPVRLRGMSLFWSNSMGQFWNADAVNWLKNDWHVTLIRAAMGIKGPADWTGSYLENPSVEKARMEAVVEAAIAAGIYVVIDWHDHEAEQHVGLAKAFFEEMARKYGSYPNVLFELYNEPTQQSWSGTIKPYHEQVIPVIRQYTKSVIILGTRLWSQEVDEACRDRVQGENLAYTIHFYASTHRQSLRNKVSAALSNGCAVFASEWGTCEASGGGSIDFAETQTWLNFLEQHSISDANWAVDDWGASCSAMRPGASARGGWSEDQLTDSGRFMRASLRGDGNSVGPGPGPGGGCCKWGGGCGDCGDDGSGWCHQSSSNCAACAGSFDGGAQAPACR